MLCVHGVLSPRALLFLSPRSAVVYVVKMYCFSFLESEVSYSAAYTLEAVRCCLHAFLIS